MLSLPAICSGYKNRRPAISGRPPAWLDPYTLPSKREGVHGTGINGFQVHCEDVLLFGVEGFDTVFGHHPAVSGDIDNLAAELIGQAAGHLTPEMPGGGENGEVVWDVFCDKDGAEVSYSEFSAAWEQLRAVRVTGWLPDGFTVTEPVHTTLTFTTVTGKTHTLALAPYDALHDAVIVDGTALFYLISGGLMLQFP